MRILLIFLLFTNIISAQLSKKHWIPPLHSRSASTVEDHYLYLSTPEPIPFQVTVTNGAGVPISGSPFTISQGNPTTIFIANVQPSVMFIAKTDLNIVKQDKGLLLEAPKDFYATFRVRARSHAEILVSKGTPGIGTAFRLGSLPQTSDGSLRNFVCSFMATEDNTSVTVSDYNSSVEFATSTNTNNTSNSQTFNLNKGQSVTLSGYTNVAANLSGFVGALITSTKPIAVNTGNALAGMSSEFEGQDFTLDQIVPVEQVGTEYILVKGNGSDNVEKPLAIATQDNTQIFVNGSPTPIATLNAGDYFLIPSSNYRGINNMNMYVTCSKPTYMYQILGGSESDATSGLNFIPPLSCFFQKSVDLIPSVDQIGNTQYDGNLIIVTYTGSTVRLNGAIITELPEPVLGNPLWNTYRIYNVTGNAKVESTGPLAVGLFGSSNNAGYAGYYSGFGSEPRDTNVSVCSNKTTNLLNEIDGNPDPGGIWTPPLASGTDIFDPNTDVPGTYTYSFTGLCQIVNVQVTVSVQQASNPGNNNQITVCKNDPSFDLFPLLGVNATTGGNWTPALSSGSGIFNPAVDTAGTYTYTITGNDVCDAVTANVIVTVNPLPVINPISSYKLCDDNLDGSDTNGFTTFNLSTKTNEILNSQTGISVTYHLSQNDADSGTNPQTSLYTNNRTIYVRLKNNATNCFTTTSFNLVVNALPVINSGIILKQCDDNQDAITSFNLTEANTLVCSDPNVSFTYYTDSLATNQINNPTTFVSGSNTIYFKVTNSEGCFRIVPVNIIVSATHLSASLAQTLNQCDVYLNPNDPENDGYAYFDFTPVTTAILNSFTSSQNLTVTYYENLNDALAEQNAINGTATVPYRNTVANTQTIYIRVDSSLNNDCLGLEPYLTLIVKPVPKTELGANFTLCLNPATGLGSQNIDATPTNSGNFSYSWIPANPSVDASGNQSAIFNVTQAGTYSVVVTETSSNCTSTDSVTVTASSEPLSVSAVLITPLFSNGLATIQATANGGYGIYEYSIDGVFWQNNGTFSGLSNGSYVILVRDLAGCGRKASNTVYTVTYPSFFTPNGDGFNDKWKIDNLLDSYDAKIYIYDRYGKLLKEIAPNGEGWDGTFNGNLLPATDYWFKIEYTTNNTRNEFKSHFSLKR